MKAALWILIVTNIAATVAAWYFSTVATGVVQDILQILGGISLLTVAGLLWVATKRIEATG